MLAGDGCFTVAVGDAAVARRCRSHVARRVLLHCGRRWGRCRPSMQQSSSTASVAPLWPSLAAPSPVHAAIKLFCHGCPAVARRRRSHVIRRLLLRRSRRCCSRRPSVQESCWPAMVAPRRTAALARNHRLSPASRADSGQRRHIDSFPCVEGRRRTTALAGRLRLCVEVRRRRPGGCSVVVVGDAAVARRCRSHVRRRLLHRCGRCCRRRPAIQESSGQASAAPVWPSVMPSSPSPPDVGVMLSGDGCSTTPVSLSPGDGGVMSSGDHCSALAVARGCRSHVAR